MLFNYTYYRNIFLCWVNITFLFNLDPTQVWKVQSNLSHDKIIVGLRVWWNMHWSKSAPVNKRDKKVKQRTWEQTDFGI